MLYIIIVINILLLFFQYNLLKTYQYGNLITNYFVINIREVVNSVTRPDIGHISLYWLIHCGSIHSIWSKVTILTYWLLLDSKEHSLRNLVIKYVNRLHLAIDHIVALVEKHHYVSYMHWYRSVNVWGIINCICVHISKIYSIITEKYFIFYLNRV